MSEKAIQAPEYVPDSRIGVWVFTNGQKAFLRMYQHQDDWFISTYHDTLQEAVDGGDTVDINAAAVVDKFYWSKKKPKERVLDEPAPEPSVQTIAPVIDIKTGKTLDLLLGSAKVVSEELPID